MMRRLVVALLLIPALAWANVAKRNTEADAVGEPLGMIDVAIVREDLAIDLRQVERGRATVEVGYQLDNRGAAKQLALIFASGASSLDGFAVTLDGAAIPAKLVTSATLPESWKAPASTPGPNGPLDLDIDRHAGAATFDLAIPPGMHRLAIRYGATTALHHAEEPMLMHQFAYVLAPARSWTSFGQLAITVQVPPGWGAEVEPALERDGDTLKGTFTGVPADAVGITTHSPAGFYHLLRIVGLLGFGVALLGGGYAVWRIMFARGKRHVRDAYLGGGDTALAFALSIVWAVAITVAGWFATYGPDLALVESQADHRGYGDALQLIGIVLLALVAILVGTFMGRYAGKRGVQAGLA
jgi:hypothetical protein